MKKSLLFIFLMIFTLNLQAQRDSAFFARTHAQKYTSNDASNINVNIYPVPVRENSFTIKSNKDISSVKVTNIIGQDIFRIKYNTPQQVIRIPLENPKRGMYLVTIVFSDGLRSVKKIMIEESE